jgi:hypothetical protein
MEAASQPTAPRNGEIGEPYDLAYSLLKHGMDSVAQEMAEYEATYRERKLQTPSRQAGVLGFQLMPAAGAAG